MKKVSFTEMKNGTKEDYLFLDKHEKDFASKTADRILKFMSGLTETLEGYQVSRLEHSLQSATRAYNNGESEEMIVAALLHDIGDILAPANHADFAATLLEPYISEKNFWILKHHGIFQGYYFFHFLGLDRNMRDNFKDNEHWRDCAEFCAKYDQNSFDPDYDTLPIETFVPMLEKVLSKTKKSIYKAEA